MKGKFLVILVVSILILGTSRCYSSFNQKDWVFSPATTASFPLLSFGSATFDGYGFNIKFKKFDFSFFKISHHSREPSDLLDLPDDWVYTRQGTFLELTYKPLQLYRIGFGLGLNKLILKNDSYLGFCIFGEKIINNLVFVRVGYRTIGNIRMVSISLGIDLLETIQEFHHQFLSPDK